MIPIRALENGYNVAPLVDQLAAHPDVWNRHTGRTDAYGTPHKQVDDIWVRYNAPENIGKPAFHEEHESSWYPCVADIPAAWSLARRVWRQVGGWRLGGVLITRVPPGGRVEPHIDNGWHARVHDKFALQIKGNKDQAFCFDGHELRAEPGDLYTFDNSQTHWVINDSDEERITMIVCVRKPTC